MEVLSRLPVMKGKIMNKESSPAMELCYQIGLGSLRGIFAKTCTAPLERVTIVLQTQTVNSLVLEGRVKPFSGVRDCITRIYHEQGLLSFWRGNTANCLRYFPSTFYRLSLNDYAIKRSFPQYSKRDEFGKYMLTKAASYILIGSGFLMWTYPLEHAHTRLAGDLAAKSHFNGIVDVITKTIKSSGIRGLYSGLSFAMIRTIPHGALFYSTQQCLFDMNPWRADTGPAALASKILASQLAAISVNNICYPFDTLSRRMQIQATQANKRHSGVLNCFRTILREEGIESLFRGLGIFQLRYMSSALMVVLYNEMASRSEKV